MKTWDGSGFEDYRKGQILQAMERLLTRTRFGQLTVKEICAEADVSRPTFYHYFKDKFDVVCWFWDQGAMKYLRECGRSLDWYHSNLGMLRTFVEHPWVTSVLADTDGDHDSLVHYGFSRRIEFLYDVIRGLSPVLLSDSLRFQIEFFTEAESRVIATWNIGGMQEPPETIARYIELCVPRELYALVMMAHREFVHRNGDKAESTGRTGTEMRV